MKQIAEVWALEPSTAPNWLILLVIAGLIFLAVGMYWMGHKHGRQEMFDELVEREERRRMKLKNAGRWTERI